MSEAPLIVAGPRPARTPGVFVTGSTMRHILVMTGSGAVGLMAIFLGDLANVLFLSLLGDVEVVAAIGFASPIVILMISIGIGLAIAATSRIAPVLGAGARQRARRLTANTHLYSAIVGTVAAAAVWLTAPLLLSALGASGRTHALAVDYLRLLIPTMPLLIVSITASSILRSAGDARRGMAVTLSAAIVNIVLDPVFIFWLDLGIHGAAIASNFARVAAIAVALYGVVIVHKLMGRLRWRLFLGDVRAISAIAVPAVLTNVATPVSNAFLTAALAHFGEGAVAGWVIISRLLPFAFGALYALSGSVGPVIGQNLGAGRFDRVRAAVTDSLIFTGASTLVVWLVLALGAGLIVTLFQATGQAADLILLFCRVLAPLFGFLGVLFVASAVFNTLGRPHTATLFTWGRATLGTVPFVEAGRIIAGAEGVLTGFLLGGIVFGLGAAWLCYRHIDRLSEGAAGPAAAA